MLGQEEKKIYLNIAEGKIAKRTERGIQKFDFVEGDLEKIYPKEREFRGEKVPYYYLDLRDGKSGEVYSLGLRSSSGVWRSLVLSLGSADNFLLPVKISPYRRGDYDRVSVYQGDKRLDWVSDLPPIEEIDVAGQKVKSTAKRDEFISRLVGEINDKLGVQRTTEGRKETRPKRAGKSLSLSSLMEDDN